MPPPCSGVLRRCDILIVYSADAEEWCRYLQDLFLSSRQMRSQRTLTYRLGPDVSFSAQDLNFFLGSRCILMLLSDELVHHVCRPALLPLLQRAFHLHSAWCDCTVECPTARSSWTSSQIGLTGGRSAVRMSPRFMWQL